MNPTASSVDSYTSLFINGEWVSSTDDRELAVVNPSTEQVIGRVPRSTVADVRAAVDAARVAFDSGPWPCLAPSDRAAAMLRFAAAIERRVDRLVELNIAEAGSIRSLATAVQVRLPLHHFVDMAERVLPAFDFERGMLPVIGHVLGQGVVVREPAGVAALITPCNFPLFLNLMKLAPALAAGCTVVLKPSPLTPLEAFELGDVAQEAELPPGVLNIVTGDIDAAQELTSNPAIDVVSFTGSHVVGQQVMQQAAPTLKRLVLELGGKSASIVFADADLNRVAADVASAITMHCGQACTALTRTLVHRSVHDDLVERVASKLADVRLGDAADDRTTMGPLISASQRSKVEQFVEQAVEGGAEVAFGGGRPNGLDRGWFVEPTLLQSVSNGMPVARNEIFGPVGVIIPFDDTEEAIRLSNDSDFGLGGAVWSADPVHAYEVARRLRTGTVSINGGGGLNPTAPFGGYKQSGFGRERGEAGMEEFLETKSITWQVAAG